jgi:hypothetical protein
LLLPSLPLPKGEGKKLGTIPQRGGEKTLPPKRERKKTLPLPKVDQVIGIRRELVLGDLLAAPAHGHVHRTA